VVAVPMMINAAYGRSVIAPLEYAQLFKLRCPSFLLSSRKQPS
jgi:hypothetical protein